MSRLLKIQRESEFIRYTQEAQGHMAAETRTITCHEAPLADFDTSLAALRLVAIEVMNLPGHWITDMTVKALNIVYTKQGTRKVQIQFEKFYPATSSSKVEKTPEFFIEDGVIGEDFSMECNEDCADMVLAMIHEAIRYIDGERQQQLLPLEEPTKAKKPEDGDELDLGTDDRDWSNVDVPLHPDTNIPNLEAMERAHAEWWIDLQESKDELAQVALYSADIKLSKKMKLENMKKRLKEEYFSY